MRLLDFCFVVFVLLAIVFIVYLYRYLHTMYKLKLYHYNGLVSDEVYDELFNKWPEKHSFKETNKRYKKVKDTIRIVKESQNTQV